MTRKNKTHRSTLKNCVRKLVSSKRYQHFRRVSHRRTIKKGGRIRKSLRRNRQRNKKQNGGMFLTSSFQPKVGIKVGIK